jgi:hypothetical protein
MINEGVNCRGCGNPLKQENFWMCDGCECNYGCGINHGLVPKEVCTCDECFGDFEELCGTRYSRYKSSVPGA